MIVLILFVSILTIARGQSTEVENCQTGYGALPIYANVEGCTSLPCNLPQGGDAVIDVVFEAPQTIRNMKTVARVTFLVTFNYTELGDYENTCNYLQNTYCPILKGEIVQYQLRMPIEEWFPTVGVTVQFLVEDADSRIPIFCLLLRIQVVDGSKRIAHSTNSSNSVLKELAPKHIFNRTLALKPSH